MMVQGPLSDEMIGTIVATVREFLNDPTVRVDWSRGIEWHDNWQTGFREGRPTKGATLTIQVHGGAVEVKAESEVEAFIRHLKEQP